MDLVVKQTRDAVTTFLTADYVHAKIAEVETEVSIPVRDVEATLEYVGKQLRFTTDEQKTILNHFLDGGDHSAGDVLHAATSTARPSTTPTTPRHETQVPGCDDPGRRLPR